VFYDPGFSGFIDRDLALATRTVKGATAFGIWPFNRYRRLEVFGGVLNYDESFNDPVLEEESRRYQEEQFGTQLFRNGTSVPVGVAFVQETTVFREFGPVAGNTVRFGYEIAPKMGNTLSRQTLDADARYHIGLLRLAGGDAAAALAQADTIQRAVPTHLFAYVLRAHAFQQQGNRQGERRAYADFLRSETAELARNRPEYTDHQTALSAFRDEAQRQRAAGRPTS